MQLRVRGFEGWHFSVRALLPCLVAAAWLTACGSDEAPPPAPAPTPAPQPQAKVEKAPEDPTAKMARAVSTAGPAAPVDVRYEIPAKPIVNQALEMDLAVLVSSGADSLTITYEPSPGLTVLSDPLPKQEDVKPGAPLMTKLAVQTAQADVFYVTLNVALESGGVPTNRSFAIPLIFSEPPAATPEAAAPAEKAPEEKPAEAPAK